MQSIKRKVMSKIIPVILSGGTGSRLWPVFATTSPKTIHTNARWAKFATEKHLSELQNLQNVTEILTITNKDLYFKTADDYREVNPTNIETSYLLEPFGRNTAAAVALSLLQIKRKYGEDAIILVLAADHLIKNNIAFSSAVDRAVTLAAEGCIVTFGINPTEPETGFGYIEADGQIVKRFIEKPNFEQAKEYFQSGNYYWNSGMFCMRVQEGTS